MDHIYFQSYYHFHPYLIELNVKQFSFFFCRNFKNLRRFVLADIFSNLEIFGNKNSHKQILTGANRMSLGGIVFEKLPLRI